MNDKEKLKLIDDLMGWLVIATLGITLGLMMGAAI